MYAKLFTSMYQGTLRGNSSGLLVFTNLLAHCDKEGVVDRHPRAIADETGLTMDEVRKALVMLSSPDPESRSPEEEGRRIVCLDDHRNWGWRVVNYGKYRAIRNTEDRRIQNREAQRRFRAKAAESADSKQSKQNKPMQRQRQRQKTLTTAPERDQPVDKSQKAAPKGANGKDRPHNRRAWIEGRARTLGMKAKRGETWEQFAKRVAEA